MDFAYLPFTEASAVERVDDGRWRAEIRPDWDITGITNGGYLMGMTARAASAACGRPDPVTTTGHFLAPARPGPVTITTEILKQGRRFTTVRSTLRDADDRVVLAAIGAFSELGPVAAHERVDAEAPDLPEPGECIPVEPTDSFPPPFMAQVDMRLHPEDALFSLGRPSGVPRVRGWFRWRDSEPLDTLGLLVACDAFPPTIFNADLPAAWTPTVEQTVHVRERPSAHEWLRCVFTTRFITSGMLEEDGELWDERGRLIAQSRQLALLPRA